VIPAKRSLDRRLRRGREHEAQVRRRCQRRLPPAVVALDHAARTEPTIPRPFPRKSKATRSPNFSWRDNLSTRKVRGGSA
jgi:hypothetical protein